MNKFLSLCSQNGQAMAPMHVVLCPFAGGSVSAFRSWRDLGAVGMDVSLAVYPGRDHRMGEDCMESIEELAAQVLQEIESQEVDPSTLIVAGHSMGAQVAYQVCVLLEAKGTFARGLVLSGCHAPHLRGRRPLSHLQDQAFLEQLAAIGGCSPELLNDQTLWPVFMPMLRADFRVTESYWHAKPPEASGRLQTPSLLVFGSADDEAWRSEVEAWSSWLNDVRDLVSIAGDHFYVIRRPRAFLEHIRCCFETGFTHAQACAIK